MSGEEPIGTYRLRSAMRPMHGQPVNWNSRAVIWAGMDRRYWLRRAIDKLAAAIRGGGTVSGRSLRYRVPYWLRRLTDNRDFPRSRFTFAQWALRSVLNTQADVEARRAWAEANAYWRAVERRRRRKASS